MQPPIFTFTDEDSAKGGDEVVARVPAGLTSRQDLFSLLADQLAFPDYFGRNWDALYDLLRDFSWLRERTIRIVHADCPELEDGRQRRMYLDVLKDAVLDWKPEEEHTLQVTFPSGMEETVTTVLQEGNAS